MGKVKHVQTTTSDCQRKHSPTSSILWWLFFFSLASTESLIQANRTRNLLWASALYLLNKNSTEDLESYSQLMFVFFSVIYLKCMGVAHGPYPAIEESEWHCKHSISNKEGLNGGTSITLNTFLFFWLNNIKQLIFSHFNTNIKKIRCNIIFFS